MSSEQSEASRNYSCSSLTPEKQCSKDNCDLYTNCADLTKVFVTGRHHCLWKILINLGSPDIYTVMIKQIREGMQVHVLDEAISKLATSNFYHGHAVGCLQMDGDGTHVNYTVPY